MDISLLRQLRPGCEMIEHDEGSLQLIFGDHTATFSTPPVVRAVKALVDALRAGRRQLRLGDLIDQCARATGLSPDLVAHVLQLMEGSHCLYAPEGGDGDAVIDQFFSAAGDTPADMRARLAFTQIALVCSERSARGLLDVMGEACLRFTPVEVVAGDPIEDVIGRVAGVCGAGAGMIAVFDIPQRGALARALNLFALERKLPAIYGDCRTALAQLGPYVLPGTTGCLECLNLRMLSHGTEADAAALRGMRLRKGMAAGEPPPAHPAFVVAMAALFACELSDILAWKPSRLLGGFLEFPFSALAPSHHSYLKVPRCPCCGTKAPPRLAWNTAFTSPDVKNERSVL